MTSKLILVESSINESLLSLASTTIDFVLAKKPEPSIEPSIEIREYDWEGEGDWILKNEYLVSLGEWE